MTSRSFLDHNATTPLRPEARAALLAALDLTANPSSPHAEGQQARAMVERARRELAEVVGVDRREVIFTSGATEALNLAVRGAVRALAGERDHVIVSAVEHDAVRLVADALGAEGVRVTCTPVDPQGRVDVDALSESVSERTALVAVMAANNETGVIQPLAEVAAITHAAGALLLVDAVQLVGRAPVNARSIGADYLAFSSHKLGGPHGAGALAARLGAPLEPILHGGAQERGRRAGTENTACIHAFAAAARAAVADIPASSRRLGALRDRLEHELLGRFPELRINGCDAQRLPGTTSLTLPGVDAETLVVSLDQAGIAVSTGAACSSGAAEPSHVLRAMGLTTGDAASTLRVSLGWSTLEVDIDRFLTELPAAVDTQKATGVARPSVAQVAR